MTLALHAAHIHHLVQLLGSLQVRCTQHRVHRLLPGAEERVHPPRCASPALRLTLAKLHMSEGVAGRLPICPLHSCVRMTALPHGKALQLELNHFEETVSCDHFKQLQPARAYMQQPREH